MLPNNLDLLRKPIGKVSDLLSDSRWTSGLAVSPTEHRNVRPVLSHSSHSVQQLIVARNQLLALRFGQQH